MAEALDSFPKALAYALTLPGTEQISSYGKPAAAVAANGRALLYPGHEQDTSFAVGIDQSDYLRKLRVPLAPFGEARNWHPPG